MSIAGLRSAVVSSVGTSLITNGAPPDLRNLLIATANLAEQEYTPDDLEAVRAAIVGIEEKLRAASEPEARRLSAELNGILALGAAHRGALHYLLATDTYQGRETVRLVCAWLQERQCEVVPQVLDGLSTADRAAFARGVDCLLRWCEQALPELRRQERRIVFNLVGGFKSLQAYAHTLGRFYADEIVYIFEGKAAELIRIPRLPLAWDSAPLRLHATAVARLAAGEVLPAGEVASLPEAFLDTDETHATLSDWGLLAWNQNKREILSDQLLAFPGLRYLESFRRDWEARKDSAERAALQEALAKTSVLWRGGGLGALRADGGLRYEDYENRGGIGHFRTGLQHRVSCLAEGSELSLRHYGPHDYVNNRP